MNSRENELVYLLRLQRILGIGNGRSAKILESFGGVMHLFSCTKEQWKQSGLFTETELARVEKADAAYARDILKQCKENGISIMGYDDERYPERLRNIPAPPLVLFVKGTLPNVDEEPLFCIVGPRKISDFGGKAAYSLAKRLTRAGFTVVSGGALGGDTATLKGALSVEGKPISVLPCGILCDYLPENRGLRKRVAEQGCLLSEHPPMEKPRKHSFLVRNRLLSGLCVGVAVVEAGQPSGTLSTAHHALEQGRDVFVIPGNPTLSHYKGSNALLCDGAKPLTEAADVMNEYLCEFGDKIDPVRAFQKDENEKNHKKIQKKSEKGLSNEAKIVYNYLDKQKFTVDDCIGTGLSGNQLLAALTELEFEDYIQALPGGFYSIS